MLSREEFLKETDLRHETVEVEGLGQVRMRQMSMGEKLDAPKRFKDLLADVPAEEHEVVLALVLVAASLCNPDDSPMFTNGDMADGLRALRAKSSAAVGKIQEAFLRLNQMNVDAVEQAAGKSTPTPSEPSSSGSPGLSATPPSEA